MLAAWPDNRCMNTQLSGRALVGHFGSASELHQLAARHGIKLSYFQVRKWLDRDRVSATGLVALLQLGERIGHPVNVIKLLGLPVAETAPIRMPEW